MTVTLAEKNTSSGTLFQIHATAATKALPPTDDSVTVDTTRWLLTTRQSARQLGCIKFSVVTDSKSTAKSTDFPEYIQI